MNELLLAYIWKYRLYNTTKLKTVCGKSLYIENIGILNTDSGADLSEVSLKINDLKWFGNAEIHIKSSDWYRHNHHLDKSYDSVILHIVYENDKQIFTSTGEIIYTLELKNIVSKKVLENYENHILKNNTVLCAGTIHKTPKKKFETWLEKLYVERVVSKSNLINEVFDQTKGNWEAITFTMLMRAFGLKVNGEIFMQISRSFDLKFLMKEQNDLLQIEALIFGQAGLLQQDLNCEYHKNLKTKYKYLKIKYNLNTSLATPKFLRLRPPNFPTIRLSQIANLLYTQPQLFLKILDCKTLQNYYDILQIETTPYWKNHYTFGKKSNIKCKKKVTKKMIDLLILNVFIPLKYLYFSKIGKQNLKNEIINLAKKINPEKNNIITKFANLNIKVKNAMDTQALIQLHSMYCTSKKCMNCMVFQSIKK